MAILKFRIYWEEDEAVYRDVAVKHSQSFQDLHTVLLKSYEFDSKHQATFYRSNDTWQLGREISLEKYEKPYKADPLIMSEVIIGSEIKVPNQKFIYDYDFVKEWRFMVELINVDKEENNKLEYPCIVRAEGIGPSQYGTKGIVDTRLAEMEEKYDLNSDGLADGFTEEGEEGTSGDTDEETATDDTNDVF